MCAEVFVSYSSEDESIADEICIGLEANNIECWMAPRDIDAGSDWPEAIQRSIKNSRAMVVVFTEGANASRQVSREITLAINYDLKIFPFKLCKMLPTGSLEYLLSTTQWIDGTLPPLKERIYTLAAQIRALLFIEQSAKSEHSTKSGATVGPVPGLSLVVAERLTRRLRTARFSIRKQVEFEGWTFPIVATRSDWMGQCHRVLTFADLNEISLEKLRAFVVAAADEAGEYWVSTHGKLKRIYGIWIWSAAIAVVDDAPTTLIKHILEERPIRRDYNKWGTTLGAREYVAAPAIYEASQDNTIMTRRQPRIPIVPPFSTFAKILDSTVGGASQ
jgi:hypothetical protein